MTTIASHAPRWRIPGACALALAATAAAAAPPGWEPSPAAVLDGLRGGFTGADGLKISLGIERMISVNGSVVSRTSLQIADLGRLNPDQARQAGAALAQVTLVQNGIASSAAPAFSADTLGGTIIQNSLNNQQIESSTLINSSVNSASLLGSIHFGGSLSDAIARAAGPR